MRIQPRQQLLEAWGSVARACRPDPTVTWNWGGRGKRNSISDAEQLLCIMSPATTLPSLRLDEPDRTADDVLDALRVLGDSLEIPQLLVKVLTEYLTTYSDADGNPTFPGGSYFSAAEAGPSADEPTERQLGLDVVDSFAVSVRLTLAIIGFVRVLRISVRRPEVRDAVANLETLASERLSAAMLGLLRSFAISTFDIDSDEGQILTATLYRTRSRPEQRATTDLLDSLREIRAGLRDVTLGSGRAEDIENEHKLFECGWSWGIVQDAPLVETPEKVLQPDGVAQAAPYLYFTVAALDCIADLFSERTRLLGLLTEEQQRLARALQLRWDMTQLYWSRIARFGGRGRWPLQDLPWLTTDDEESDYLSLLVSSIVVQDLRIRRAPQNDVILLGEILRELAGRARITRRPQRNDPALSLHAPGYSVELVGSEQADGPRLAWKLSDFSAQLLKQTLRIASLLQNVDRRGELLGLADDVWDLHIKQRRLRTGVGARLWDQTTQLYGSQLAEGGTGLDDLPSWYYTERVIGCLVEASQLLSELPLRDPELGQTATAMLAEADHLFDQQLLAIAAEAGPAMNNAMLTMRATLRRAREVLRDQPGTAIALASEVLRDLDRLAVARRDATGGS